MNCKTIRHLTLVGLLLLTGPTGAQNLSCQISPFSGASLQQGAVGTMTVVNNGRACGTTLYGLPAENRNPATRGVITEAPKHGKAEFVGPRIQYTPESGYAGEDAFSGQAWATGTSNATLLLKIQMKVQVLAPR